MFQAKTPTQKQDGRIYFTTHEERNFDTRHISSLSPLPKTRQPSTLLTCPPNLTGHQRHYLLLLPDWSVDDTYFFYLPNLSLGRHSQRQRRTGLRDILKKISRHF